MYSCNVVKAYSVRMLALIASLLMMGLFHLSYAGTDNNVDGMAVSVSFSEVSENHIVGYSPELAVQFSAIVENGSDTIVIEIGETKVVTFVRHHGNTHFDVKSHQSDTGTCFMAQVEDKVAIDLLGQHLWQYKGYLALGDELLKVLAIFSSWPQSVAFDDTAEFPVIGSDGFDPADVSSGYRSVRARYPLFVTVINPAANLSAGSVKSDLPGINCSGNGIKTCMAYFTENNRWVRLTATPVKGYKFGSWQGCTIVNGNICLVSSWASFMETTKRVTARFAFDWSQPVGTPVGTPNWGNNLYYLYDKNPDTWTEMDEVQNHSSFPYGYFGVQFSAPQKVSAVRFRNYSTYWNHIQKYSVLVLPAGKDGSVEQNWVTVVNSASSFGKYGWIENSFNSIVVDQVRVRYLEITGGWAASVGEMKFVAMTP